MTKLTKDINRVFETPTDSNSVPVVEKTIIFQGSLIGRNPGGYGRPFQSGDIPVGFAKFHSDNSNGGNGEKKIEVKAKGKVYLTIEGVSIADAGKKVYAIDDDTFTLTSTGNSFIGYIARFEREDTVIVAFDFLSYPQNSSNSNTDDGSTPAGQGE